MPTFSTGLGRQIRRESVSLKASAAETASTNGATVELGDPGGVSLVVDVTAASGTTPTLTVAVQGSDDGTNWHSIGTAGGTFVFAGGTAPANITGVSTLRLTVPGARFMRYASTIGGTTPSFTYSVTGTFGH